MCDMKSKIKKRCFVKCVMLSLTMNISYNKKVFASWFQRFQSMTGRQLISAFDVDDRLQGQ
jgi:hypothetical protein